MTGVRSASRSQARPLSAGVAAFRKHRGGRIELDVAQLGNARSLLDAIGQTPESDDPVRWLRLERACEALRSQEPLPPPEASSRQRPPRLLAAAVALVAPPAFAHAPAVAERRSSCAISGHKTPRGEPDEPAARSRCGRLGGRAVAHGWVSEQRSPPVAPFAGTAGMSAARTVSSIDSTNATICLTWSLSMLKVVEMGVW